MPKMGDNVTPTQENRRGNGNKPQQKYLPLPKMWLMGVNEGKKQEQERIIKLLEAEECTVYISCANEVIALIKGEKK